MAKHVGLKIKLTVPVNSPVMENLFSVLGGPTVGPTVGDALALMDNQSIGHAIRESIRAAGRPAAVALKSLLQTDLVQSDQSTGATERSISIKYGRSRRNPNWFYLIVGSNKTHTEYHTVNVPEGQIAKIKRGRKQRGAGLFAQQTRTLKNRTTRSKQVFSRYRNPRRIAKLKRGTGGFRRVPAKYFHLIDHGFDHRLGVRARAYNFLARLQAQLGSSTQTIFSERIKNLVVPTIIKEIKRKTR